MVVLIAMVPSFPYAAEQERSSLPALRADGGRGARRMRGLRWPRAYGFGGGGRRREGALDQLGLADPTRLLRLEHDLQHMVAMGRGYERTRPRLNALHQVPQPVHPWP